MSLLVVVILAAFVLRDNVAYSLTCRDEDGNAVDWFIVYKIPLLQNDPSHLLATGYAYAFMTGPTLSGRGAFASLLSRSKSSESWQLSSKLITDDSSIFAQTLSPLYQDSGSSASVLYNDQPPSASGEGDCCCLRLPLSLL